MSCPYNSRITRAAVNIQMVFKTNHRDRKDRREMTQRFLSEVFAASVVVTSEQPSFWRLPLPAPKPAAQFVARRRSKLICRQRSRQAHRLAHLREVGRTARAAGEVRLEARLLRAAQRSLQVISYQFHPFLTG